MQRRKFVKSSCTVCLLAATGYMLPNLLSCSPAAFKPLEADVVNNTISFPLSSFNTSGLQIIQPKGWEYNIAVQKKDDGSYETLLLQCTHQDNQLTSTGNGYTCSLHGSQFDKDGNVTHGPASEPLHKYITTVNNGEITINVKS